ncbi:MAG: hypothetical protein KF774_09565 [Planctomyces sp.]|nr:hypothetical protein [Planctomyces sp.]
MISEFRAGAVLSETFRVLLRSLPEIATLTILCNTPSILLGLYEVLTLDPNPLSPARPQLGYRALRMLVSQTMGALLSGALSFAVYQALRNRDASVGEAISAGLKRVLPLIGVAIVQGIAIGCGLILLIIPGLILLCMLWLGPVICVVESSGPMASLERSRELTKGHRSTIFAILFTIGILFWIAALAATFGLRQTGSQLLVFSGITALQLVLSAVAGTACVVSYFHLRSLKESVDVEDIARVFE